MNSAQRTLATIVITALIVGGGTFLWFNRKVPNDTAALRGTIENLNHRIAELQGPPSNANAGVNTESCEPSHVAATLTNGNGTAGTFYYTLALSNTGTVPCTIDSAPTIAAMSANGTVLGTATPSTTPSAALTVAPGGVLDASLGFPNPANFPSGTCKPMDSLRLTLANVTGSIPIPNIAQYNPVYTSKYCQPFSITTFSTPS